MIRAATLLAMLAFTVTPLRAEVLLIDAIADEPPNSTAGVPRPAAGDNMQQVEGRFGIPQATRGPVGEPPISRWDYPAFSVYFEYDRVLSSVVHR